METGHQQIVAPDNFLMFRALPPLAAVVGCSAKAACRVLLAHVEQATDLLLCTPVDSRIIPGRWWATQEGAGNCVQCELVRGPMRGLYLSLCAEDAESGGAVLQVEGSYLSPVKPLLARQRAQQLAEALRTGLVRRLQDTLAPQAAGHAELRAVPRQALAVPVRLRVGDSPWPGVTRDVSAGGLGLLIPAMPEYAAAAAAQIGAHSTGTVELLVGEGRLTSQVQITRARPWARGIDVGLCFGEPEEGTRLQQRLTELNLWRASSRTSPR